MNQVKNKEDAIKFVADKANVSQANAKKSIEVFLDFLKDTCADGDKVRLIGEISVEPAYRAPRKGRNPQTGEEIDIAGKNYIKFSTGKNFNDAVAGVDLSGLK